MHWESPGQYRWIPRFSDSRGGLTGLSLSLHSELRFIVAKYIIVSNEKGTWGEVLRKAGTGFQESSPSKVTQDMPDSPSTKCCHPQKLETRCPHFFTESLSHRHSLPGLYPNSRLPEGKQVLSTNHCL